MILANSNRSLRYLLFLSALSTSGCSQQATKYVSINTFDKDGVIISQLDKDGVFVAKNKNKNEKLEKIALKKVALKENIALKKVALEKISLQKIAIKKELPKKQIKERKTVNLVKETKRTELNKDGTQSIWSRMFALYALPDIDNKRVDEEMKKFLKHPSHLVKIQRRAEPYLHLIMDEIESKNIPGELALLPIIESSYRANVTSPASAAGLWQFIPSTGLSFGLKQNWWYDGRRDVYASTRAATKYLKKLSKSFDGDWFLALASYNVGIGNVKKAIRRNKKQDLNTNYWSLKLPKETRDYVPKLLALAKLFANAEKYKLPLKSIPDRPFFKVVNIGSQLGLSKAAKMANMKFDEFFILNPAFNRVTTPPNGPHRLLVKIRDAKNFKYRLNKLPKNQRVDWIKHKIKKGDSLKIIAKLHKTHIKDIVKINKLNREQVKNIEVGKVLKIPPASIRTLVKTRA
ncbi:MAG: transglycosylase SLT domain-containing protein [Methylococcales bacterium]|nr:transglycosylase SLT domain-containing protein [Methylococcales bacterium]